MSDYGSKDSHVQTKLYSLLMSVDCLFWDLGLMISQGVTQTCIGSLPPFVPGGGVGDGLPPPKPTPASAGRETRENALSRSPETPEAYE